MYKTKGVYGRERETYMGEGGAYIYIYIHENVRMNTLKRM